MYHKKYAQDLTTQIRQITRQAEDMNYYRDQQFQFILSDLNYLLKEFTTLITQPEGDKVARLDVDRKLVSLQTRIQQLLLEKKEPFTELYVSLTQAKAYCDILYYYHFSC